MNCSNVDWKLVLKNFAVFCGVLFFLYFFLVGLSLLGDAFKIIAGDSAGSLFGSVNNPIAGLMVGILATVLVQSSSTTTSIIVAAAGAGVLPVVQGIPMVMGANIGTSVTNTLVSVGFVGDREQYRRAFSGATVHDMFNYMNVVFWLPVELISSAINHGNGGVLFLMTEAMAKGFQECSGDNCDDWEGPLKVITEAISKKIITVDKDVIKDFATGRPTLDYCREVLCNNAASNDGECTPYVFHQKRCAESEFASAGWCGDSSSKAKAEFSYCVFNTTTSVISTNQTVLTAAVEHFNSYKINKAGVFEQAGLQREGGIIALVMSLVILILSLLAMVKLLGIAIRGAAEEALRKALNMNGYLAIIVGAGVTMFVQSSSITTSVLTPLVAIGALSVEGMLPLTLGANIGTTLTGVLASLVSDSATGFQLAMVHVMFNVLGVVMFYPVPFIRAIPIRAAKNLGDLAATYKSFPIFYIIMLFLVYPGAVLGVSLGIEAGKGGMAGGIVGLIVVVAAHLGFFFWYFKRNGRETLVRRFGYTEEDDAKAGSIHAENSSFSDSDDGKVQVEVTDSNKNLKDTNATSFNPASDAITQV
mmetsp:Transcript_3302/g.5657  ORF Transcript_3302/g.5657 Transcript_3302/m.5657 type:complete len:589 (-) Transcript_3302:291-2057(-)